jgi:hypothetical protein
MTIGWEPPVFGIGARAIAALTLAGGMLLFADLPPAGVAFNKEATDCAGGTFATRAASFGFLAGEGFFGTTKDVIFPGGPKGKAFFDVVPVLASSALDSSSIAAQIGDSILGLIPLGRLGCGCLPLELDAPGTLREAFAASTEVVPVLDVEPCATELTRFTPMLTASSRRNGIDKLLTAASWYSSTHLIAAIQKPRSAILQQQSS